METWTVQKLLKWITGFFAEKRIDSPRLSAEMVLGHVLSMKRIELYTQFDKPVHAEQLDRLREFVRRAGEHEPVAYLVGSTEFYSLQIDVTPDCMIPRPETEMLVERAVEFLRERIGPRLVCDLCTGSGCVAVAIAANVPDVRLIATDISAAALRVAARNVHKHKLKDNVTLLCGDLFDPLLPQLGEDTFDLIVCNPPYVSAAEFRRLDSNVRDYEPTHALLAGTDGLDVYRRIAEQADEFLKPDGALMLETGYAQGPAVRALLEQAGTFRQIRIERDQNNNDRLVTADKRPG